MPQKGTKSSKKSAKPILSFLCLFVAKFQTRETLSNEKKLKPGVIRYPGGCFADQYDWRDGVGPRDKRKYESNHFGTDEFVSFCKMVGAEPYLAANVRSRDVRVFFQFPRASVTRLSLTLS